jgi:FkbM family methyltransferase
LSSGTPKLDPDRVLEAETDLGVLWVEKDAEVMTPALLNEGYWDPTITGLIRKTLKTGSTFVDAGANIGYFSVLASRLVGPTGRVFAIEPDPVNLTILSANLKRHGCSNTTVLPVAAWKERAELNIERAERDGAITQVGGAAETGRTVPAAPLDELIEGTVDYLKVDTELTDHIVVASAAGLIAANPSMLITVEFHPWERTQTGDSPSQVLDVYREMGLVPYEITDVGDGVNPTTYERIADPGPLPDGHNCFDFAMSRQLPRRLRYRKSMLERAGDMLEYVPERIRPKIRRRDRKPVAAGQRSSSST